jgi:hypothetical protein
MPYHWRVYKAMLGDELKGYVYAQDEDEAQDVWDEQVGGDDYQDVDNEAAVHNTHHANQFIEIEDLEFYASSEEEGGAIVFLAPNELTDMHIEPEMVEEAHVFYVCE